MEQADLDVSGVTLNIPAHEMLTVLAQKMAADPNIVAQFIKAIIAAPAFWTALRTLITQMARTIPSLFGAAATAPKGSTAKSTGR